MSLGALSCALLIASCSESAKEYETPQAVCGVKVPAEILDPLLPEGEKVSERSKTASGVKRCYVSVDDKVALSTSIEWYEADTPIAEIASKTVGAGPEDKVSTDKRYSYSGKGGAGLIRCEDSSQIDKDVDGDLYATVRVGGDDSADAAAVLKVIEAYTDAVPAAGECEVDL
ncbi:hypothetical protein [Streptomyces sp. NBC_01716]|uniref:hypothetical protein n=1 Tax=Streptomyces sp. NBC_01716 TaxID=2975917 RepID=UPI002E310A17|nr:hypothetical protein [Streptomyces sp. NBC_01716]